MRKKPQNIVIIGCSGTISIAFAKRLLDKYESANIHVFGRQEPQKSLPGLSYGIINYEDESSIEKSALKASDSGPIDLVIVATGVLHGINIMPERSLKELSLEKFQYLFRINAINPALIAKHFLPKLNKENFSFFAALSARIGSI